MSTRLPSLSHGWLLLYLIEWLDEKNIRKLDKIVMGSDHEMASNLMSESASIWLSCLHNSLSLEAMSALECGHSWIRWLMKRKLSVSRIRVSDSCVEDITDETFADVCIPSLKNIELIGCSEISDASIMAVVLGCPNLELIDISDCSELTDAALISIGDHCHGLKTILTCGNGWNITDAGISALTQGCSGLQSINICNCSLSDAALCSVGTHCHELATISMVYNRDITDVGISALAKGCPHLKSINLSYLRLLTGIAMSLFRYNF
jgi:Leucine Rich repeat